LATIYAVGWVHAYHDTWDGWNLNNSEIKNNSSLQSLGIALSQTWQDSIVLRAMVARQLGPNHWRNPQTGEDADGSSSDYRAWFQAIYYF
jgi:hypothetical protein